MWVVEIIQFKDNVVVKTIDCGDSERKADRVERGVLINLNTDEYGVRTREVS